MPRCLKFRDALNQRLTTLCLEQVWRWYAVKELPWCKKTSTQPQAVTKHQHDNNPTQSWTPIPCFGVVAAMSLNRVIGVDGSLPWEKLEQDRKIFTDLTANQLIILGRATFHEKADLSHIRHVGSCIVVSTKMSEDNLAQWRINDETLPDLKLAGSFPEALDIARKLCEAHKEDQSPMTCWVVGGERLYNEAVMHPSLDTIHLSIVDRTIDEHSYKLIRRFPPKYRWDHKFTLVSREMFDSFEYQKYSRNRGFV